MKIKEVDAEQGFSDVGEEKRVGVIAVTKGHGHRSSAVDGDIGAVGSEEAFGRRSFLVLERCWQNRELSPGIHEIPTTVSLILDIETFFNIPSVHGGETADSC